MDCYLVHDQLLVFECASQGLREVPGVHVSVEGGAAIVLIHDLRDVDGVGLTLTDGLGHVAVDKASDVPLGGPATRGDDLHHDKPFAQPLSQRHVASTV